MTKVLRLNKEAFFVDICFWCDEYRYREICKFHRRRASGLLFLREENNNHFEMCVN